MSFKNWLEQEKNLSIKDDFIANYVKFYYATYRIYCEDNNLKFQDIKEIDKKVKYWKILLKILHLKYL